MANNTSFIDMATKGCCIEWEQETILYLDNELPESGRARVEKHLRQCKYCAALYHEAEREAQLIGGRLRHLAEANLPGKDFTDELMGALPSSAVVTLRGQIKETVRNVRAFLNGPARVHLAVAASLIICFAALFAVFQVNTDVQDATINLKRNGMVRSVPLFTPILVTYEDGEFFEFPDGSIAYAAPNTLFNIASYQQESDSSRVGTDRQINLIKGELFFDIQPAKEGFNVVCANSKTTVFGTQFCVGIIPEHHCTYVAVREGQVFVEKRGGQRGSTVLKDKQMTQIINKKGKITLCPPIRIERIDPNILVRLDQFNEARSNRQVRGLLHKSGFTIQDGAGI